MREGEKKEEERNKQIKPGRRIMKKKEIDNFNKDEKSEKEEKKEG